MRYLVTEQIESPNKVTKHIEVTDFFFVLFYMAISFALMDFVHQGLRVVYMIFSAACCLFLTAKSPFNRKRRNYESMILLFSKDETVYRPIYGGEKK